MGELSFPCVYGLGDPRDGQVRYVGQTFDLAERLLWHADLKKHRRPLGLKYMAWRVELSSQGLEPEVTVLQQFGPEVDRAQLLRAEKQWIEKLGAQRLVNAIGPGVNMEIEKKILLSNLERFQAGEIDTVFQDDPELRARLFHQRTRMPPKLSPSHVGEEPENEN